METKRKIPYGVMNWAKLVRECFLVDNTAYIRTLENVDTPVFLRQKRFGKSVVCSMLAHYYDVNLKCYYGVGPHSNTSRDYPDPPGVRERVVGVCPATALAFAVADVPGHEFNDVFARVA